MSGEGSDMASPAPLLRPPIPGSRSASGSRTPRLGLAIPPSPASKPVNPETMKTENITSSARPAPPSLRLATPSGGNATPQESRKGPQRGRLPPLNIAGLSAGGSSETSENSRSGSSGEVAAGTSMTNFAQMLRQTSSHEQLSAVSSSHSTGGTDGNVDDLLPDLEKLSIDKGRPLDADDLDDAGWRVASRDGKIEEIGSLGEGAGGAVTRCRLKGAKTVFALKIITTDPNPDVRKQIIRELEFNKSCASDHICKYFGAFTDSSGTISIAMEFCEGGSLDSIYREVRKLGGRTGERVLGKVAEGVIKGLTYLHGRRIIHRDIKPSNILLCRDGQVKLCDFGVSGEFGTKGDANTFIGTSYYMAPERITGQSYTITSDVWSLGVTLLEVAQHRFPFPADGTEMQPRAGLIDLLTYIVRQPTPTLNDEPDNKVKWSESFKYFIECCLEKEGQKRAAPWRLLEHPWILEMQKKKVNMEKFLREVWGWTG
ncbi:MAG: Protein kinase C signaling pathway involved MAPKK protein [Alyxoria varia]|nr:MAG: Protein kinase C signaling pathway involved MAPKK protein [Alyxoria varia]